MRDRRRAATTVALAAAIGIGLSAPVALAQEITSGPWKGSKFDAPFTSGSATVATQQFGVSGTFVKDMRPFEQFVGATLTFAPEDASTDESCYPSEPLVLTDLDSARGTFDFEVEADHFTWSCNGSFTMTATARTSYTDSEGTEDLEARVIVAVPPDPVTDVAATPAGDVDPKVGPTEESPESVTVTWKPVEDDQQLTGYSVRRSGPDDEIMSHPVSGPDAASFVDEITAPGTYSYVVFAMRDDVPSAPSSSVEVSFEGPPAASTTTTTTTRVTRTSTTQGLDVPSVGSGRGRQRQGQGATRPRTPTTIDTGFNETLDYGDQPPGDGTEFDDELAGEGQSIVRTDEDGVGLLAPAAGAMVLLGWAGHVAYLNRLARQF